MAHLTVGGAWLFVEREGAGPPLVLLHGHGEESGVWAPVAAELARRSTVVRYDLRGHGRSHGPPAEEATLARHLADLAALLDALALGPVHLAGHDLGGVLAQSLAYAAPGRVRTLVLESTLPAPFPERPDALTAPSPAGGEGRALAQHGAAGAALYRPDRYRRLGAIDRPTLVVVGELDSPEFQQGAELLHGWIPNSRLVRIEEARHAPHVEQPARFLAALLPFLDEFSA